MTSAELRAAANQLLDSALAWIEIADPEEQADELPHWQDQAAVARAYLAIAPSADDEEPADPDWFRTLGAWRPMQPAGNNELVIGEAIPMVGSCVAYPLTISYPTKRQPGITPTWIVSIYVARREWNTHPTRGYVRAVLRVLGIEVKA